MFEMGLFLNPVQYCTKIIQVLLAQHCTIAHVFLSSLNMTPVGEPIGPSVLQAFSPCVVKQINSTSCEQEVWKWTGEKVVKNQGGSQKLI